MGTATITDDDPTPSLTINDVTVNEAAGTATFTVTLSAASGQAVSVNYATSNGTATAGADFTATSGTLNFAPGVTSQTVTVTIANDAIFEQSESYNVNLSGAANATIADNLGLGTIKDDGTGPGGTDNDTPTLAVSSPIVTEGTDGFAIFTVSLSNASTTPVSVGLALANGTALGGGTDYGTGGAGNLQVSTDGGATWVDAATATIAAGSTSVLVRTPILNDALDEAAETFTLTATKTAGTTTNASAIGTATIIDDDPTPLLTINDVTVNEAAGTATFTVTLDAASGRNVSVNYGTSSGTATSGVDFSAATGTVNFAPGVTTQTVTVPIFNDAIFENSESFNVTLSSAVNATLADNLGIGTIKDDGTGPGGSDNDTPTLTISNVSATEGTDTHAVFTVALSNPSTTAVVVSLALANGTATGGGVDFGAALEVSTDGGATWSAAAGATIAAGNTSALVRTPIVNDALNEAAETFTLTATRTGGTTTNLAATGTGTIIDNDATPSLAINDVTVNEAAGTATFTVTLNAPSGQAVSVNYATGNGTALAGADYTAEGGTLNFGAGVVSQTITVPILNDTTFEGSENFNVLLSGAVNATIADATGVGTIVDDGTGPGGSDNDTPSLSVSNVTVTEGANTHAVFAVSLSNLSTTPVIVSLALANGSALGGGTDYGTGGVGNLQVSTDGGATWADANTATIAPGAASVLVRTPIIDDALDEAAETFTLTATRTAGTTTNAVATGTATINDNDPTPSLVINDVTVNEGAGTATFTVTLSATSGQPVSVSYATSNGTATSGADYTGASGTLNFAPGVTSQTITVSILNDTTYEGSESYSVLLSSAVNATIADATGIGTILDDGTGGGGSDNDVPVLAVSSPTVTEGADPYAVFTVSLSNAAKAATTVSLALASGSALGAGTDYGTGGAGNLQVSLDGGTTWSDAASATFAPGSTSVLVRTPIANDAIAEPLETFTLTATTTAGATRNANATGLATIADDDGAPSLTIDDVTVNEAAGTATFTVRLTAVSALPISVDYTTSNGTATAGADFTTAAATLNFAPGVTAQTITVPILNDAIFEGSEKFNVLLSNATNSFIADDTGVGTIKDDGTGPGGSDNDTPALSVSSPSVTEGTDPFAVFTVSLSNASTTPVSVNLALANGTATGGGVDFGAGLEVSTDGGATWNAAASATIAAGSTSVLVRTPIINDTLDEPAENFTLTATRTAGTTTNLAATGTATITDNDPTPSFTINDITVNEGAGTATFTVTLSAPSGQATSVAYATASGTATSGADFSSASGTLNFLAGVTTQTVTVPILNDVTFEGSENFTVVLSAAVNSTIADNIGIGTILDDGTGGGGSDDDTPTLGVSSTSVVEGTDGLAVFTVSLSNPSASATSFNLALANGSAAGAGTDYGTGGAGNLQVSTDGGATWNDAASATIAAGSTSVLVRTPIVDDVFNEAPENFTLTATVTAGTTTNPSALGAGTIGDDDGLPSLSIDDVTVNEAAGTMTFTVRLNVASGIPVSVDYATSNGTATAGADYAATSGSLTFNVGDITQTITVPIFNDAIFENSESFNVTLTAPVNAILADDTGVGTIRDNGTGGGGTDDDTPTLSVSNVSVTEGTDLFAVFNVSLSNASTTPVSLSLALADGSAAGGGADFGTGGAANLQVSTDGGATWLDATTATIAPGSTSVLVRTPITDDALDETAENFTLTANLTGGTMTNTNATGTATIIDNDPTPTLSINDVTVNEAAGTATFTVTLSAASALPVSVGYATSNGTATAGADFTGTSGTLSFAPGVTSQTITISIANDAIFEQSESYDVILGGEVNATIADGTGLGTIKDDGTGTGGSDDDTPTLSVSNVSVTEGTDPYAVFAVTLSNASTTPVSVSLALADGAATGGGVDFGAGLEVSTDGGATWTPAASATFAPGSTSVLVRTPVVNDAIDEFSEDFTLTATVTAGITTNANATGLATIADDDATPTLSIDDVTVNEAAGTATFTVTLSAASGLAVSANFATSNGTATAGADFTGTSGTLNFAPGVTSQTITVSIANDTIFEQSENFNVVLSAPVNATIADGTGLGTILDDGTGGGGSDDDTPTLSVSNVSVTEGTDTHAVFTVSLSNLSTTPVNVSLALANGTATGGGVDFGAALEVSTDGGATWTPGSTATIAAGTSSVLVRTPITDDALNEAPETFTLTATRTLGTTTNGAATGIATIVDNDALPSLSINDVTVNEGAGTATFTVTLSAPSGQPVSVGYTTSDATALAGADFTGATGTLNFAPGVTSQTVTISILNDTIFEHSENFAVLLGGAVNAAITDGTGIGTILDDGTGGGGSDDDTPTLSVSNVSVTEGTDSHAVFAVNLSNVSTTPVSVNLALANGTATGGGVDFGAALEVSTDGGATWNAASSATIAAGSSGVLVRTPITDDTVNEAAETFTLTATRTAGFTINANATGIATIVDNDALPTLAINDVTVNEGAGTATFTVTLSAASGQAVLVSYSAGSGTALLGADFSASSGALNFAPGVTSQTVTVPITNDAIFEGSENFVVTLAGAVDATIADATGIGTILDDGTGGGGFDNDTPSLSVSSVAVTEGTDTHAVFEVDISNPSTTPVTVALALVNGTATGGGVDFGPALEVSTDGGTTWAPAASATIAPGSTSVLVRTPINDDLLDESAEAFTLNATVTAGTTLNASAAGIGSIADNDGPPDLSIDDVTVNEAAGTATFTVSMSAASGQTVKVNYATSNSTALAALDFTSVVGTLTFAPGVTTQTVTVPILNDAIFENSESFFVLLSGEVNAGILDDTGVGTIRDNGTGTGGTDDDTPTLSVSNVSVTEGTDSHAIFTVSLSNLSTTPVDVNLALANGTATGGGVDFGAALEVSTDGGTTWVAANNTTIAAGTTSVLVRTPITDDALDEAVENFTLTATVTGGTTTNLSATGTGTIIDDDPTPTLSINDVTVNEGAGTATFTVTLSAASALPVSVGYATSDDTATAGADYTAKLGTLNFAPGVTSQTITISIANDAIFEQSETFDVLLGAPVNATIADGLGLGTILDDGTGGGGSDNDTPMLTVSSVSVTEGTDSHAVFAVTLSNPSTTPVDLTLALADGTATGGGTDFGPGLEVSTDGGATWTPAGSATFAPGSTSVLVRTPITDDALDENAETFTLTATVAAGITTNANATGTATIADNDATPTLAINDVTVNEAAGTATFTVTLSAASGLPVSVAFATSNGTATAGADYTAALGTLNFAPGVTSQTITISIANDAIFEKSESFNVLLSGEVNATIADGAGLGTILDDGTGSGGSDDDTPTLSVSNVSVTEGTDPYAVFAVTLSNASTTAVTVSFALADGSATGGGVDFGATLEVSTDGGATWTPAGSATFAPGGTSVLVRTPVTNDALDELSENFTLTATVTAGTTTNPSALGTATITDDDPTPTLVINDVTVNEGAGTATFTVTLSAASALPVSVAFATSNGTATAGADYTAALGTLNFAPGVTTQTITISIANDALFEQSENFNVLLSTPLNATIADATGLGTILDDGTGGGGSDDDTPTLGVSNVTVTEGTDPYAVFTVSLSNPSTTPVNVNLALANGTATGGGVDFGAGLEVSTDGGTTWVPAASATFAPGSTSVLVRTPVINDAITEGTENFTLTATVTGGTTKNPSATGTGTIIDDEVPPSLSIDDLVIDESAGTATFTVTLSSLSGFPVSVNFTTVNGTAATGTDYTAASGTLNFAPGVTSQTVIVPIVDDGFVENTEAFQVVLSGAVNAVIADASGTATILDNDVRQANLTLISTSDAGSTGSNVVVGEVVTYELKFELAEGANAGVVLHDLLPAGLQFLPNAPVQVAYLNAASTVTGLAAGTYTNASADAMISASLTANDDVYGDGTDVFFKLGALTNNDGPDADREYVTIRFSAVVTNTAPNQTGALHDDTFAVLLDSDGNGSSGYVSVDRDGDDAATGTEIATDALNDGTGTPGIANTVTTVAAEPILVLNKQITSAPAVIKPGDTIVYTVTITHAAGSGGTAWEATLADAVPVGLQFSQIDSVTLAGGAQVQSAAAIGGGGSTLGGVWDIPVGGSVTVVYRATVTSSAVLGSTLNNLADLTWSSLDGVSANERGSGNGLLGGGGLNDYQLQQAVSATIDGGAGGFSLYKQVLGDNNVEIGERVTYQLTLSVADGIINSISLNDLIPSGFRLVNGSATFTAGTGVAASGASFIYAPNQLTLDIAQLQSAVDGIGNTITITYDVDVLDSAANDAFGGASTAVKTNVANASYDPGSGPITVQDSVTLNLVEPVIASAETVVSAPPNPNAGDAIAFQVVIGHGVASTGNAYHVVYTDTLPAEFRNVQLTGVSGTAGTLPSLADFLVVGNTITTLNPFDVELGGEVVLTYTAVIKNTVTPGEVLTNNAVVTAQSTSVSPSGNTRGSGSPTNGANYTASDTESLTADATFNLAKLANVSTARIGDRVHYTITVNVIEGTTPGLVLSDVLPAGLAIDAGSIQITYGAPGMASSNASPASVIGNTLALDFATLTNPGDNNTANDTIKIEYDEVVSNNASNNSGDVKTNLVDGTYTGLGVPVTTSADVTIAEPVLDIQKTVDDATPHLGQTVTYTIVVSHNGASTAGAFDLTLSDPLPAGVSLNAGSIQLASAPPGTTITTNTSTNGGALQLSLSQLPLGESVTITFTATVSANPAIIGGTFGGLDDTLTSTVALGYDSQAGSNPEQRAGSGSVAGALTVVGADLAVTIDDGQATANAGSRLTYTITVTNNGTDDATNVLVSDGLPSDGTFNPGLSTAGATLVAGKVVYSVPTLAVGATETITVVVDLATPTSAGLESVTSVVDVTHDDIEPTPADNTAADTDTLLSAPDYQITVTDNRTSAKPGETVNYVITVTNVGNQNGTGVIVSDVFATGIFSSFTADHGGVVDLQNGSVTWNLGALAAGDSIVLALRGVVNATFTSIPVPLGTVPGAVPDNDALAHTVNVADDGLSGVDPTPANNTAADLDDLQPVPELKITTTDNVSIAKPGQTLTYTIVATNAGAQDANGMIVTSTLPDGVKLKGVSSSDPALSGTPVIAGRTLTWTFTGTVPAGTSVTFAVVVQVEMDVKPGSPLVSRATIADDGAYGPDSVTMSDNAASDTDTVPAATPVPIPRPAPRPAPVPAPFVFAFDTFHNFADEGLRQLGELARTSSIDPAPDAILPLVPIYSGEADPGATLVISLYNARGEQIGSQTVVVDSGGNWLATFASTNTRDIPNSVKITALSAPYSFGDSTGHNLRTYFSPALNPGNFVLQALGGGSFGDDSAPLLGGLGLENPLQLGSVKYGGELLGTQATAGGY
ncbi:MAG: Calx-beta domain-containing protein [Chthoniobacteraceae bacterium]